MAMQEGLIRRLKHWTHRSKRCSPRFIRARVGNRGRLHQRPKPTVNLYNLANPLEATVQGNYRLTADDADADVRHIILDLGSDVFPVLEGQSIGITPPGENGGGNSYKTRLYSVSSPRDGERPNTNNLSLTVKREQHGVCSNYVCSLKKGDKVKVTGPFGSTFLMPNDPQAQNYYGMHGNGLSAVSCLHHASAKNITKNPRGNVFVFLVPAHRNRCHILAP